MSDDLDAWDDWAAREARALTPAGRLERITEPLEELARAMAESGWSDVVPAEQAAAIRAVYARVQLDLEALHHLVADEVHRADGWDG